MNALSRRLDARSSAVLVKEVRAALRGRLFRLLFVCTLTLASTIAVVMLADVFDRGGLLDGREFFRGIHVCLCIALFGLVSFSAFTSMGAEWDESTIELLVTSDLRPRQIVLGKLGSAAIEALLYASAFAPFLAFAFLMQGLDALGIVLVLQGTFVASLAYAAVAVWLSCLARARILRVLLLAAMAFGAFLLVLAAYELSRDVLRGRSGGLSTGFEAWILFDLGCLAAASFAIAFACQRLAHEEENRSTAARVVATVWIVVLLACLVAEALVTGHTSLEEPLLGAVAILTVLHLFFATEMERLPRRVRAQVPRSRVRALLAAPFLPGGGRAILLFALQLVLLFVGAMVVHAFQTPRPGDAKLLWRHADRNLVFAIYGALYVVLGSLIASPWTSSGRARLIARIAIPVVVVALIVVPAFLGLLTGNRRWANLQHPLNPFEWLTRWSNPDSRLSILTIAVLLALACLASLPRIVRGVREVLDASRARESRP